MRSFALSVSPGFLNRRVPHLRWGWWIKVKTCREQQRSKRGRKGTVRRKIPRLSSKDGELSYEAPGGMPGALWGEREQRSDPRPVQEEPGQVWLQWWECGRRGWGGGPSDRSNVEKLITSQLKMFAFRLQPLLLRPLLGPGWGFCMWCFFREELQQLVEMQRHWEAETLRALKSYLKIAKEDGWRARETGDGSRSFLGDIWGGREQERWIILGQAKKGGP